MRANEERRGHSTTRGTKVHSLKTLTDPIAEYVAAAADPRAALAEVMSELIGETIAIEVEAQRYLENRR
jgi:hypothetical protein